MLKMNKSGPNYCEIHTPLCDFFFTKLNTKRYHLIDWDIKWFNCAWFSIFSLVLIALYLSK